MIFKTKVIFMENNLIMFNSVTFAIRSRDLLNKNGIDAMLVRTPSHLRNRSCGYSLLIINRYDEAKKLILNNGIRIKGEAAVDFK